jgi:hypothetical protein
MKKYEKLKLEITYYESEDTLANSNFGDGLELEQSDFFSDNLM